MVFINIKMAERKVRYRGRKVHPKSEKRKVIFYPETPKKRWTWKEKLYALFLWVMLLGMTYYLIKWLIGVIW